MTADVARVDRARANFNALLAYKQEGERRGIPAVIREIWAERQWLDLGYGSYGQACAAILGEDWRNPWPVEERREIVAELRGEGMSTRAIASAVGVSHETVRQDASTVKNLTVEAPDRVTGLDGRSRPATVTTTTETTEIVDLATGEILGEAVPGRGRERVAPKRRPLPDQIRDAVHELVKATERVERLLGDDRYPKNAEQVAAFTRGDLLRAAESLHRALSRVADGATASS